MPPAFLLMMVVDRLPDRETWFTSCVAEMTIFLSAQSPPHSAIAAGVLVWQAIHEVNIWWCFSFIDSFKIGWQAIQSPLHAYEYMLSIRRKKSFFIILLNQTSVNNTINFIYRYLFKFIIWINYCKIFRIIHIIICYFLYLTS